MAGGTMNTSIKWAAVGGMTFVAETGSGHAVVMDGAPEGGGVIWGHARWKWCSWARARAPLTTWCSSSRIAGRTFATARWMSLLSVLKKIPRSFTNPPAFQGERSRAQAAFG